MAKAYVTDEQGDRILIADSDETIKIEGNHYFPPASVKTDYFKDSDTSTTCFWKGEASYKTIDANGKEYSDAVFHYDTPMKGGLDRVGKDFTGYYAFWRGVEIED